MLYSLKKFIGHMLFPLPLSLICLGAAVFFAFRKKTTWIVKGPLLAAFVILGVCSFQGTAVWLLRPLETVYVPLAVGGIPFSEDAQRSDYIVVLGGGVYVVFDVPPASRLSTASLGRLVEGVRLANLLPKTKLLFTGGLPDDPLPMADAMSMAALSMGMPPTRIERVPAARDTAEEADSIATIVGEKPFILVTSATHMPRAMKLFQRRGMHPIAAPAQFVADQRNFWNWDNIGWNIASLEHSTIAVYEYLGNVWVWLTGLFETKKPAPAAKQPSPAPEPAPQQPASDSAQHAAGHIKRDIS